MRPITIAEPLDTGDRVCRHCHEPIKRVIGGQGPTWIHDKTQLKFCTEEK